MQAQTGYEAKNSFRTIISTIKQQNIYGLYRGSWPQFLGSMIFRSAQFGAYVSVSQYMNGPIGEKKLPLLCDTKVSVVVGGFCSGVTRAFFETPLDYWKIRRQIVKEYRWKITDMFTGFRVTMLRGSLLMTAFFIYLDIACRNTRNSFEHPLGTFLITGVCTTAAWWTVWPLEYMKTQVQGGYGAEDIKLYQRMRGVIQDKGFLWGVYRGIGPGTVRSFFANGISMVVMNWVAKQLTIKFGDK